MTPRLGLFAALVALAAPLSAPPAIAQETPDGAVRTDRDGSLRIAARASADNVQVGEPFTVGVVVQGAGEAGSSMPQLLDPGESWEQLEVARIESSGPGGEVRAYYRLVAWEAGRLELPTLRVESQGDPVRSVTVQLPAPWVRSVLPDEADAADLKLRGPRPPLESGWPWWLWALLALLAAALGIWWWRRHRAGEVATVDDAVEGPGPDELARDALVALRQRAVEGELGAAEFYDRLEEILRQYLAATREWPPTRPTRSSAWLRRDSMRELHRHAVFSRFGGVDSGGERLVSDADVSLDWLAEDAA